MRRHQFLVNQCAHVFLKQEVDFVDFMAGAETVEEMHERQARFQRRHLRDHGHVLRFLHTGGGEQGPAGGAGGHHIAVIAEDGQRVGGQCARRDMEHRGREFAGDLEHIGQHQQQPLRGGEGRRQCAGQQRAVHRAGRTRFALHLDDLGYRAPQIFLFGGRPGVGEFAHAG